MSTNKGYDKVTVIGVTVCVIALLAPIFYRYFQPAPQVAPEPAPTVAPAVASYAADVKKPRPQLAEESLPTIDLEGGAVATIAPDGSGIQGLRLENYNTESKADAGENPAKVVLGNYDYPFMALNLPATEPAMTRTVSATRSEDGKSYTLVRENGRLRLTECWSAVAGKPYELNYSVTFANISGMDIPLIGCSVEGGAMPVSVSGNRKAARGESAGGATIGLGGGDIDNFNLKELVKMKPDKHTALAGTSATWTAVHSKYFLLASWLDGANYAGIECSAVPSAFVEGQETLPDSRYHLRSLLPAATLAKDGTLSVKVVAYAGPKMFEDLYAYGRGLDAVMELDRFFFWRPAWMRQISRGLLRLLVIFSRWFPENCAYGLAIVLLTLLVKLVFWPLSHKSAISMKRMAALKPQLDELKAKYKDDPQTMYRKQQELYKANNVSQLGGCLPMLLQIPVFFALFNTFRNAIEVRHAGFFWAHDLSMPDTLSFMPFGLPIRPLAILMGVAMYLQQKLTPTSDPNQAKMMNFMTIFFIFLFYNMPSALTLYLSVSYVLGIVQTQLINKLTKDK